MTESKLKILDMIENGIITAEEGNKLLSLLVEEDCKNPHYDKKMAEFKNRFESHADEHEHFEDEMEEIEHMDDHMEDELSEHYSNKYGKKFNLDALDDLDIDLSDLGDKIENIITSAIGNNLNIVGKDGSVIKKQSEETNKEYENCVLYIKYLNKGFKFDGDFKISELLNNTDGVCQMISKFTSKETAELVAQLVEERFVGTYKNVFRGSVLKIRVE